MKAAQQKREKLNFGGLIMYYLSTMYNEMQAMLFIMDTPLYALLSSQLFSYLSTYIWDLFLSEIISKVKPNINSVEVYPQLSNNGHPVDGAMVGDGSLCPHFGFFHGNKLRCGNQFSFPSLYTNILTLII
jgi:hypothetical protein